MRSGYGRGMNRLRLCACIAAIAFLSACAGLPAASGKSPMFNQQRMTEHRDGDDLLYVLATDWKDGGRLRGPVVGTLMTNYGLERAFAERGIEFLRTKVGDRYVHQALLERDGILGGETSGHLLCLDRVSSGDGIVSALQVLEVLRRRGLSLQQLLAGFGKVPQKTVNVKVAPRSSFRTERRPPMRPTI